MSKRTQRLSRRGFLRQAAAAGVQGAAGLALAEGATAAIAPWQREADVIVIGSGACGICAAIVAREAGREVLVVEAEAHAGGHAIISGGYVPLGGGTSLQRKYGVEDSPDLLFRDLTDWSVIEPNGFPDYRYNDREIIRAFADHSPATFEWLVAHGVTFMDRHPDIQGGLAVGNSVPRSAHAAAMGWLQARSGQTLAPEVGRVTADGCGLMRPLLHAAEQLGVQLLLEHRMLEIHREQAAAGRVVGITVEHQARRLRLRARQAVVIATGGSTGNVNFRRIFDPRLTEEYQLAGMPWSNQDASGELAGMAIGASLWGAYNQVGEFGWNVTKTGLIGCRYGYTHLQWPPSSEVFGLARASGLHVGNWQNLILVNMLGDRFYDETGDHFTANSFHAVDPYSYARYTNAAQTRFNPNNFINAALAGIGDGHNGGGPIWAIFDADAVAREGWQPQPPNVDPEGYFFSADSLEELARRIVMPYQRVPMPVERLQASVARYNGFVAIGRDEDFGQQQPRYRIAKPPFYAAWATPIVHDSRAGLRINANCQVVDLHGAVIEALYCGGESAGGFGQHGLARATCQGFIAGTQAARMQTSRTQTNIHK